MCLQFNYQKAYWDEISLFAYYIAATLITSKKINNLSTFNKSCIFKIQNANNRN